MKHFQILLILSFLISSCGLENATPVFTPTPSATITPSATPPPTLTPTPIHPLNTLILHEADETLPLNWFSYVPSNINRTDLTYVLICGASHSKSVNRYDYEAFTDDVGSERNSPRCLNKARALNAAMIIPVFPQDSERKYYVSNIDWKGFLDTTDSFYGRPDLKVNLMVDRLQQDLRSDNYTVADKILMQGFSAGGAFAQRYTILHPERVQAIAAGAVSFMTMPEVEYNGTNLDWPLGIYDFTTIMGTDFNHDAYMQVHQLIYVGELDDRTLLSLHEGNRFWRRLDQITFVSNNFGATDPTILQNQVSYLNELGYENITFSFYLSVGHTQTQEMENELLSFLNEHK